VGTCCRGGWTGIAEGLRRGLRDRATRPASAAPSQPRQAEHGRSGLSRKREKERVCRARWEGEQLSIFGRDPWTAQ
jgi:hypothetical protein